MLRLTTLSRPRCLNWTKGSACLTLHASINFQQRRGHIAVSFLFSHSFRVCSSIVLWITFFVFRSRERSEPAGSAFAVPSRPAGRRYRARVRAGERSERVGGGGVTFTMHLLCFFCGPRFSLARKKLSKANAPTGRAGKRRGRKAESAHSPRGDGGRGAKPPAGGGNRTGGRSPPTDKH